MTRLAIAAVVLAASGLALAQPLVGGQPGKPDAGAESKKEATLKVGSKAPAVKADKWVKGTEVKSFESGKVYVMEFWATWCPPCIKSIPLLTDLKKTHKDVTVIGMASSETRGKPATAATLDKVEKFVKDKGAEMDYTVAYDAAGAMGKDWLRAAGQGGIPCAFVVGGDGKVTWIGNPLNHEALVEAVDAAVKAAKPAAAKPTTPTAPTTPPTPSGKSPTETPKPAPKPKG